MWQVATSFSFWRPAASIDLWQFVAFWSQWRLVACGKLSFVASCCFTPNFSKPIVNATSTYNKNCKNGQSSLKCRKTVEKCWKQKFFKSITNYSRNFENYTNKTACWNNLKILNFYGTLVILNLVFFLSFWWKVLTFIEKIQKIFVPRVIEINLNVIVIFGPDIQK